MAVTRGVHNGAGTYFTSTYTEQECRNIEAAYVARLKESYPCSLSDAEWQQVHSVLQLDFQRGKLQDCDFLFEMNESGRDQWMHQCFVTFGRLVRDVVVDTESCHNFDDIITAVRSYRKKRNAASKAASGSKKLNLV